MNIKKPWNLVTTPDESQWSFSTMHDAEKISWFKTTGDKGHPIEGVTLYKNWVLRQPKRATEALWGNYVFSRKAVGEAGVVVYYWVKAPVLDSLGKPSAANIQPFRSTPSYKLMEWPTVIKFIKIYPDYTAQRAGIKLRGGTQGYFSGPEYYAQFGVIPGGRYGTKVVRFEYFSALKFNIPRHNAMVGTSVSVMLPGRETIHFPESLHAKLFVEPLITSSQTVLSEAGAGAASAIPGQLFPSTEPFEDWGVHVIDHDQKKVDAGWYAWKDVAYPPDQPDMQLRTTA